MAQQKAKGSVLVFSLIVLAIVLSSALSITAVNVSNRKSALSTSESVQSFQSADSAAERLMTAIYNKNYPTLNKMYDDLKSTGEKIPSSVCPGALYMEKGAARASFLDTAGNPLQKTLTRDDCEDPLWRDILARVKVEGTANNGATRVIETGIAPLTSMAWGSNASGQIGSGSKATKYSFPVLTVGGSKWKSLSAGGGHVLAVKRDGTLWAWGRNDHHQLGNGDRESKYTPIQIGTDTDWESVSAGGSHSFGIKTDHTLWAWGNGEHFMLGNGSVSDVRSPTKIDDCAGGSCPSGGWKMVSAGLVDHSLSIGMDDTLWTWGNKERYKLGNNDTSNDVRKPTRITSCSPSCPSEGWKMVSAGDLYGLAIGLNDKLYAWGSRENYQLGIDTGSDVPLPTVVGADTWRSVSAGENHALGIQNDGTLWSWGSNAEGQLGRGGSPGGSEDKVPTKRSTDTDWIVVAAGSKHSLAIKMNGINQQLWTWGQDTAGQLGNGGTDVNTGARGSLSGNWQALIDAGSDFSVGVRG